MTSLELLRLVSKNSALLRLIAPSRTPVAARRTALCEPAKLAKTSLAPVQFRPSAPFSFRIPVASSDKLRRETSRSREAGLNLKVLSPLNRAYPGKVNDIVSQATDAFFYHNRKAETNPELYELFEGGYLDEAIETLNLRRWAIGRPKIP